MTDWNGKPLSQAEENLLWRIAPTVMKLAEEFKDLEEIEE